MIDGDGPLRLELFGSPSVATNGQPIALQRKPMAMLAYLAVSGERVARSSLADLLWPESDPSQAATNLRKATWTLKQRLGEGAIEGDPLALWATAQLQVDVSEFERGLAAWRWHADREDLPCEECRRALVTALELYEADLLAGFGVARAPDFDDWQIREAERLRSEALRALDALVAAAAAGGATEAALEHARHRLRIDPLDEPTHRRIMRLLAGQGRRAAALRQFEACRDILRSELDVDVDDATTGLRGDIEAGRSWQTETPRETVAVAGRPLPERIAVTSWEASRSPSREMDGEGNLNEAQRNLLEAVLDESRTVTLNPGDLARLAVVRPRDMRTYLLGRVAVWCGPRHQLNTRFVSLNVLVDQGQDTLDRWRSQTRAYHDLGTLVDEMGDAAVVVVGGPGSGKSTLLRRLELDTAAAAVRGESNRVPVHAALNRYAQPESGRSRPAPWTWLRDAWVEQRPDLPSLEEFVERGRALFLLDGLNEMPRESHADYRHLVARWQRFLSRVVASSPGCQAVLTCRSLDYSAPLSSADLPVPQARLEPLSDRQVLAFLDCYCPGESERTFHELRHGGALELFRTPYFLRLLAAQVRSEGTYARDRAALFTAVIRNALRRELERASSDFADEVLLSNADRRQILHPAGYPDPYTLPTRGYLLPALAGLAFGMQSRGRADGDMAHVSIARDDAEALLATEKVAPLARAAGALGLLETDVATDHLQFTHQLLQEYFAARHLVLEPEAADLYTPWRAGMVHPDVAELLGTLPRSERLPSLPPTGWEETTRLAALMSADPATFVRLVAEMNLVLAARCADGLGERCDAELREELVARLIERSRDPTADLRARMEAGFTIGALGDPRLVTATGPQGPYRLGPLVRVPAGRYPIGSDDPLSYLSRELRHHVPRHEVELPEFQIGRFPVTNAEFACFLNAGGYEDVRWWNAPLGRAWLGGEGTAEGQRQAVRFWWRRFRDRPEMIETQYRYGEFSEERYVLWRRRIAMSADALEHHLEDLFPNLQLREPRYWRHPHFNKPAQPVVGISWPESRAYAAWLSAQTGLGIRLPTEVEWEAAARGAEGRSYAHGEAFGNEAGNCVDLRIRRTTPIGIFPDGDSPTGIADMAGNCWDWTSSAWGRNMNRPSYRYPYVATDGREDSGASHHFSRVVRGGSWTNGTIPCRADYRGQEHPFDRTMLHGFRLCVEF